MVRLVENNGGRPPKTLTDDEIIQLEALACVLTKSQLADYFGMTEKTLRAVEERQPEVSTAYRKGRARAIADVGSALYQKAVAGNIPACKFFLQTQAGWSERKTIEWDYPSNAVGSNEWLIKVME